MEESSSSELGNIKNENIDLMAEIARLQEENAMLKMKLKKK